MLRYLRYISALFLCGIGLFLLYTAATTQAAFIARIVSGAAGAGLIVLGVCLAIDKNLAKDFITYWPWM